MNPAGISLIFPFLTFSLPCLGDYKKLLGDLNFGRSSDSGILIFNFFPFCSFFIFLLKEEANTSLNVKRPSRKKPFMHVYIFVSGERNRMLQQCFPLAHYAYLSKQFIPVSMHNHFLFLLKRHFRIINKINVKP